MAGAIGTGKFGKLMYKYFSEKNWKAYWCPNCRVPNCCELSPHMIKTKEETGHNYLEAFYAEMPEFPKKLFKERG